MCVCVCVCGWVCGCVDACMNVRVCCLPVRVWVSVCDSYIYAYCNLLNKLCSRNFSTFSYFSPFLIECHFKCHNVAKPIFSQVLVLECFVTLLLSRRRRRCRCHRRCRCWCCCWCCYCCCCYSCCCYSCCCCCCRHCCCFCCWFLQRCIRLASFVLKPAF